MLLHLPSLLHANLRAQRRRLFQPVRKLFIELRSKVHWLKSHTPLWKFNVRSKRRPLYFYLYAKYISINSEDSFGDQSLFKRQSASVGWHFGGYKIL